MARCAHRSNRRFRRLLVWLYQRPSQRRHSQGGSKPWRAGRLRRSVPARLRNARRTEIPRCRTQDGGFLPPSAAARRAFSHRCYHRTRRQSHTERRKESAGSGPHGGRLSISPLCAADARAPTHRRNEILRRSKEAGRPRDTAHPTSRVGLVPHGVRHADRGLRRKTEGVQRRLRCSRWWILRRRLHDRRIPHFRDHVSRDR